MCKVGQKIGNPSPENAKFQANSKKHKSIRNKKRIILFYPIISRLTQDMQGTSWLEIYTSKNYYELQTKLCARSLLIIVLYFMKIILLFIT